MALTRAGSGRGRTRTGVGTAGVTGPQARVARESVRVLQSPAAPLPRMNRHAGPGGSLAA
jgi:hypothetical protein